MKFLDLTPVTVTGVAIVLGVFLVLRVGITVTLLSASADHNQSIAAVVHRCRFHALSRFPGPPLAAISDWYTAYYSIKGSSHLKLVELHKKYGPIVRVGPNKLSASTVTAVQEIYNTKKIHKSKVYECICPAPGAYSVFTAIDKDLHRHKRKTFSQAFSATSMRAFEPRIQRESDIFIEQLTKSLPQDGSSDILSDPIDMTMRARYYATDLTGEFAFGESFQMQTEEENRFLINTLDGATFVTAIYFQYPGLQDSILGRLAKFAGSAKRERFGRLAKQLIDKRLSEPSEAKKDLFHFLSEAKDPNAKGQSFTLDELWAEARFTLIAGADTTGTSIASTLFYLSRYPKEYLHLTKVIRNTFATREDIQTGQALSDCEYLWACIDEAMRLSPPISTMLWREVTDDGLLIDGEYVPRGHDIGVSMYVIHHDETIFPDPYTFKPERWLKGVTSEDQMNLQRKAFNPFMLGSRKCLGMPMAQTSIALCLAKTLWLLDMQRPHGPLADVGGGKVGGQIGREKVDEFQMYEHVTSNHEGPYLQWRYPPRLGRK